MTGTTQMNEAKADKAMEEILCRQQEIDLDEQPTMIRKDFRHLDFRCDENGDLQEAPVKLEKRGVSPQTELWSKATLHTQAVVSKLREIGREDLAGPLADCHTEETCQVCTGCQRVTVFLNRCERHYCPTCQPRLARERRESVSWWAKLVREPKHVVLTCRNFERINRDHVQWLKQCLGKLRRRKFAANWRGGFYRMEVTNTGKGWHLHFHLLVDAGWIDAKKLALVWAEIVEQEYGIVKVKDVHSRDYLAEVTKYTVKGSQLAGWTGEQIAEFCDALDGVRTFGVFGDLYGKRSEWRDFLKDLQTDKMVCACGCGQFRYLSPNELQWERLRNETASGRAGVPPPWDQADLPNLPHVEGTPRRHWYFE